MTNLSSRAVILLAVLTLAAACSSSDPEAPRAGASCAEAKAGACDGPKSQLVCHNGTWTPQPCNGPEGCVLRDGKAICDMTQSQPGDVCLLTTEDKRDACSMDGTKSLTCTNEKWAVALECTGPDKCKVEGAKAVCDQAIASVDAACPVEGNSACSADGTKALVCKAGKFAVEADCLGANKCRIVGGKRDCDQTLGNVDGACLTEGTSVCSVDGTKLLKCTAGKFAAQADCLGANKCRLDADVPNCDQTRGNLDGACLGDGYACSVDGTKILKCTAGKYALHEDCASTSTTCKLATDQIACE